MITARRKGERLKFTGKAFSKTGRAKKYGQRLPAFRKAVELVRRYGSALRGWRIDVEPLA